MPKRSSVWFPLGVSLFGPFSHPTIDVDGVVAAAEAGAGAAGPRAAVFGPGWFGVPGGVGPGITPAWFCFGAEPRASGAAGSGAAAGSGPSSGSGAWSCAPAGLRPVGICCTGPLARRAAVFGAAAFGARAGTVCAHGSAAVGGATTIGTTSPTATETDASRGNADISHPSRANALARHQQPRRPQFANVTIVTGVKTVVAHALMDTQP